MDEDEIYDEAGEWTDEYLEEMLDVLDSMYAEAEAEVAQEWNAFFVGMAITVGVLWLAYQNAGPGEKRDALQAYKDACLKYTQGSEYRRMVEETARRMLEVNRRANAYVNDRLPDVFLKNFQYAPSNGQMPGLSLADLAPDVIIRLLPKHVINGPKDIAWNVRNLNNIVQSGILAGDDIETIARRISKVMGMNLSSARRIARTMVTGAQNRGRLQRYLDLESQGIIQNKVWVATADARTRDWHMDMDGQTVGLHEPFIDGLGNELMYPGDPGAPPETVYNCRCTMYSEMVGVRRADGSIRWLEGHYGGSDLHDRQIAAERARRAK